ncbi:MAG: acyl-CoA synthetase [Alphaproteobacteria bacterium]|nr:acyl-CoA synthetase [Alphaproteobacteria bacterium]
MAKKSRKGPAKGRTVRRGAKKPAAKGQPKSAKKKAPPAKVVLRPRPRKSLAHRAGDRGRPTPHLKGSTLGHPYEAGLERNAANFQPLTPITFLERAARTYPDHTAIIHGRMRLSYAAFYDRARRLASALSRAGVRRGDTVAVLLSNTPPMLEAHYGVPMVGAVLNALNIRLDAAAIAFMLDHGGAKLLIVDREFAATARQALKLVKHRLTVVDYDDPEFPQTGERLGSLDYEAFLAAGDPEFSWSPPADEWEAISLSYTSGTTGDPKGVVYHHRGAALMCYANTIANGMDRHPVYLWTLPMFHCNGWCFTWSLAMAAGTHVCLRAVRAKAMYDAIADHKVTHLCGAPIVMSTLLGAAPEERRPFSQTVHFTHAAAPPPQATVMAMLKAGFALTHAYGLTETYGPAALNEWHEEWNGLSEAERGQLRVRQGVRYPALESLSVIDPQTMEPVPADAETLGEVMFRGNIVMKGYLKNPKATRAAFAGGWFHSGDLGVLHPDGYIQLRDRSKDIIISGGENISSIEVEDALMKHPAVMFAAVVARPDAKWGETPCAFVELSPGHSDVTGEKLIAHCRNLLAHYKCPSRIRFIELPKTSTGKIQKFKLREMAKAEE